MQDSLFSSVWSVHPRIDHLDFEYIVNVNGHPYFAELCTDFAPNASIDRIFVVSDPSILSNLGERKQQVTQLKQDIDRRARRKGEGVYSANKQIAFEILDQTYSLACATLVDWRFGVVPVVKLLEDPERNITLAHYPKARPRGRPRTGQGVLHNTETLTRVFPELMNCYFGKAVAFIEKAFYGAYKPQSVYLATELRNFIATRIDTKIDHLISSEADSDDPDAFAVLVSKSRKVTRSRAGEVRRIARSLYDQNRILLYELELAREILFLLCNSVYRHNHLPHRVDCYEKRVSDLIEQITQEQDDVSPRCQELVHAFEQFKNELVVTDDNTEHRTDWPSRLSRLIQLEKTVRTVDLRMKPSPVQLAYTYGSGIRDAEEFGLKFEEFAEQTLGQSSLSYIPSDGQDMNFDEAFAQLYLSDALLVFQPARIDEAVLLNENSFVGVAKLILWAIRLEKRVIVVNEPGSNLDLLVESVSKLGEEHLLSAQSDALTEYEKRIRNILRNGIVWTYSGSQFDDAFSAQLRTCLSHSRAQKTIDQSFCYRAYFTNPQWKVFRALTLGMEGKNGDSLEIEELIESVLKILGKTEASRETRRSIDNTLKVMTEPSLGSGTSDEQASLVAKDGTKFRSNVENFVALSWGTPNVPGVVVDYVAAILSQEDSKISQPASQLNHYLIHRSEQMTQQLIGEGALAWAEMKYDPMTKMQIKASFIRDLQRLKEDARSSFTPISILVLDIDDFKQVNDNFGHEEGDKVIIEVANEIRSITQTRGNSYRAGGEEFAVILANHTLHEALVCAERIRISINGLEIGLSQEITVSVGVYESQPGIIEDAHVIFDKADKALYEAKGTGKNKSVPYTAREATE